MTMIPRELYMERMKAYKDNKLIKVITGLRRCGKSTLLQLFKQDLLRSGVTDRHIIDINFELMDEGVKKRELSPLAAIHDNYEKTILSMDKTYITDYEGILYQNIIDFLLSE